jgi:hypothetical protein
VISTRTHSSLTFVLPFAVPATAFLPQLEKKSALPTLKAIVQHAKTSTLTRQSVCTNSALPGEFSPHLAYEHWLAQQLNLPSLPIAPLLLAGDGGHPGTAGWAVLQPVHIHAARDHLILHDPNELALTDVEASALLAAAKPVLDDLSSRFLMPHPQHWYVGDENIQGLRCTSPARAIGRSIDIWLPVGEPARFWRKLQNEIQMIWHDHPVNQARAARGAVPVNSLWLFGQGKVGHLHHHFDRIFANEALLIGIGKLSNTQTTPLPHHFSGYVNALSKEAMPKKSLIWLDLLAAGHFTQNWSHWQDVFTQLERNWLAPAYQALQRRQLKAITLVLMGEQGWLTIHTQPHDHWCIWRRRRLDSYFNALS